MVPTLDEYADFVGIFAIPSVKLNSMNRSKFSLVFVWFSSSVALDISNVNI